MLHRRRAHATKAVGAGCDDSMRCAIGIDLIHRLEDVAGQGVSRHANRDRVLAAGDVVGGAWRAGEHEGEWAGPVGHGELLRERRHLVDPRPGGSRIDRLGRVGQVHDHRMALGATLGGVDARDGARIIGACREAVDGLGRQ